MSFTEQRLARIADMEAWHFWFRGRRSVVRRVWRAHVSGTCRVLDLGCGTGSTLGWLHEQGHDVVGLDVRPEGLEAVRRARPAAVLVRACAPLLPLSDASFDVVLMLDVLEHVDERTLLEEVRRVLRPGGWLIATVPALPWLWSHRDRAAGHLRRYSRGHLEAALSDAGLMVRDVRFYQFLLLPLAVLTRVLGRTRPRFSDMEERPPRVLNGVLSAVSQLEARCGDRIAWPVGSSLVAACQKP